MNDWTECRIGKVINLQQGLCINNKSNHLLADEGFPLLRITDLINNTEVQYINKEKVSPKFLAKKRDLIYTRTGQVGLIFKGREGIVHNNCFTIIPGEELDSNYLYWFLKTDFSYDYANGVASGAAQPDLNHDSFKSMYIQYPKKKTQQKIAAILSSYDELIENNHRRIAILENMAEEIYREWFVRFRFPGYQSAEFEKGIPKGWEIDFANKYFEHVKGKSYTSEEIFDEPEEKSIPFINLKSFNRGGGYRKNGLKYYTGKYREQQVVKEGDVVMAVTDMTQNREVVGRVARIPNIGEQGAVISLDVIKLIPKSISSTYLYSYMKYSGFGDFIKAFANGANVLHLNAELVTQQRIVVPPENLRIRYEQIVNPIHKQINFLSESIQILEQTRSQLLPRLISGKLSVENLDIQFPLSMIEDGAA